MLDIWEEMFPNVRFTDKIEVEYKDGTTEKVKHLYFDDMPLEDIDWENVVDCYELQLIYIAYYEVVGSIKLTSKRKV